MKRKKRSKVENWLFLNRDLINATGIDKKMEFPIGTLQKFLKYNRSLNDERIDSLYEFLKKISIKK